MKNDLDYLATCMDRIMEGECEHKTKDIKVDDEATGAEEPIEQAKQKRERKKGQKEIFYMNMKQAKQSSRKKKKPNKNKKY